MNLRKKALLARLMKPADDGSGMGGGSSGGVGEGVEGGAEGTEGGTGEGTEGAAASGETKPKPTDAEAKLLREVMKKKQALEAATSELDGAKAILAQLEELGGLDSIKELVKSKTEAETAKLEAKGEWDRLKQRMADEHNKKVKELQAAQEGVAAQLNAALTQINELTIGSAFSNSGFIKESLLYTPAKTRVLFGQHFDLVDGKVVGFDKPRGAADRTPLVDSTGNPVGFDEALRKIVEADEDRDSMLRAKTKPGAGSDTRRGAPEKKEGPTSSVDRIKGGLAGLGIQIN